MNIPEYIERPLYLERVMPYVGKDLIKVFVGQRRVGKSYLLFQVMDRISAMDPDGDMIYINKELYEFAAIRTADDLMAHIAAKRRHGHALSLFIDELQDIDGFETALRSLQVEGNVDIYVTGSNAKLLSGELATYLSGRYVEIKVYGLTYGEFLTFHGVESGRVSLENYLKFGGLPYLKHLPMDETVLFDYLRNVLDAILLKDIVSRYDIRNVSFLQRLTRFLADNVGSLVTARKISEYLKSQKITLSHNLVINYMAYLSNALLVLPARRCDIAGKKVFEIGEKYYFEDLGIRHALVGYRSADINKILENVVFMHLKVAGWDVTVGRLGEKEVDFVCEKGGERLYVQVAYLIADETVREREFGNLLMIPDNYPKIVVSMDAVAGGTYKGIGHVSLENFLGSIPTGS